ncbi:hypothetical protein YC2023_102614 [Brassica napus]
MSNKLLSEGLINPNSNIKEYTVHENKMGSRHSTLRSPYSLENFTGQEPGRYNPPPLIGIRPRIPKPTSFRPIVR